MRPSSPAWVANGYQTVRRFSSRLGQQRVEFAHRVRLTRRPVHRGRLQGRGGSRPRSRAPGLWGCKTAWCGRRGDHQPGVGLGEAGEVVEVAVETEQVVAVAVAHALRGGRDDGDAAGAELGGQARAALGVKGVWVGVVHGHDCAAAGGNAWANRGNHSASSRRCTSSLRVNTRRMRGAAKLCASKGLSKSRSSGGRGASK